MNPKIKKTREELERTKAKFIEFQTLIPQLEKSIIDMENTEIIKAVRSADVPLDELPAFIASLKEAARNAAAEVVPEHAETYAEERDEENDGDDFNSEIIPEEEDSDDDDA